MDDCPTHGGELLFFLPLVPGSLAHGGAQGGLDGLAAAEDDGADDAAVDDAEL